MWENFLSSKIVLFRTTTNVANSKSKPLKMLPQWITLKLPPKLKSSSSSYQKTTFSNVPLLLLNIPQTTFSKNNKNYCNQIWSDIFNLIWERTIYIQWKWKLLTHIVYEKFHHHLIHNFMPASTAPIFIEISLKF